MPIKSFRVSDALRVDVHSEYIRILVPDYEDESIIVELNEVKNLIAQLIEATIYLCDIKSP
jgi:hypothetical protein